jgi:hypothetical protein
VLASAAIHSAAAVQPAGSNAAAGLSFGSTCTLSKGSAVVFGDSAACRYFAYAAPTSTDAQGTVAVDSAIEWSDSCSSGADLLTGLEARLSSSGGSYIAGVSKGTEYIALLLVLMFSTAKSSCAAQRTCTVRLTRCTQIWLLNFTRYFEPHQHAVIARNSCRQRCQ